MSSGTRGLLCPSWIPNTPLRPTPELLKPPGLGSPESSPQVSQILHCSSHGKINSFKRLKEARIRQKNEQGRVVKQLVYRPEQRKRSRFNSLDDAKTIESVNSPRESGSFSRAIVEESIIIMRGSDPKNNQESEHRVQSSEQPQTPFFKRRITFSEMQASKDNLKCISINPALLVSLQLGLLCHYELIHSTKQSTSLLSIKHENILQMYSVFPYKGSSNYKIVLYQPYTETLSEHVLRSAILAYRQFVNYMAQTIKILSYLRDKDIYPQIQPTTVLLSHSSLKIKLRASSHESTQRQTLRQFGYYFSSLLRSLSNTQSQTPSCSAHKLLGLTIAKRLDLQVLLQQFIKAVEFSLDQAYLKIQALI